MTAEKKKQDEASEATTPSEASDMSEVERIDPDPRLVVLSTGTEVSIKPMRMREFFKLLRIITRGGAEILGNMRLSLNMPEDEFIAQFLALLFFAIPEAEQETEDFLKAMVQPNKVTGNLKTDEHAITVIEAELDNPELEDMFAIIEAIVRVEAKDLQALGNRMRAAFNMAEKTGQLKTTSPQTSAA